MELMNLQFYNPFKYLYPVEYNAWDAPQTTVDYRQEVEDDLPLYCKVPPNSGENWVPIKMIEQIPAEKTLGGPPFFFFVFRDYSKKLTERKEVLEGLEEEEGSRVKSLLEVPLGGIFLVKDEGGNFSRVTTVKICLKSGKITYFAIDEGKFGTCKATQLFRAKRDIKSLEKLVVPGMFETEPPVNQLEKFEAQRFCLAQVLQPVVEKDAAPRKINLFNGY